MEKTYRILKIVIVMLLFAVILAGAYLLYNRLSGEIQLDSLATQGSAETEAEKEAVPDFTVYDREGNPVKLSDFRGKPVILNFWASWCGPCVSEMPDLQTAYDTYGDQIHFVLVNVTDGNQETMESATQLLDEKGYTFPVYFDTEIDAAMAYGVNVLPVSFFVDQEGYLVAWTQGAMTADSIQKGINMLLETL